MSSTTNELDTVADVARRAAEVDSRLTWDECGAPTQEFWRRVATALRPELRPPPPPAPSYKHPRLMLAVHIDLPVDSIRLRADNVLHYLTREELQDFIASLSSMYTYMTEYGPVRLLGEEKTHERE